jgi:hypothetical protein
VCFGRNERRSADPDSWPNDRSELYKDIFVRHPNHDNKNVLRLGVGIQSSWVTDSGRENIT